MSPGLAWDFSISKHRKCCKYHSKCNYQSVINTTSLAETTGGFSCFSRSWQWAGTRGRSRSPDTKQANVSGMPPVWDFVFSPSLAWCSDGRCLLLPVLDSCNVFLEQWLSVRMGCIPAAPECHWFGSTRTFPISSSAVFRHGLNRGGFCHWIWFQAIFITAGKIWAQCIISRTHLINDATPLGEESRTTFVPLPFETKT